MKLELDTAAAEQSQRERDIPAVNSHLPAAPSAEVANDEPAASESAAARPGRGAKSSVRSKGIGLNTAAATADRKEGKTARSERFLSSSRGGKGGKGGGEEGKAPAETALRGLTKNAKSNRFISTPAPPKADRRHLLAIAEDSSTAPNVSLPLEKTTALPLGDSVASGRYVTERGTARATANPKADRRHYSTRLSQADATRLSAKALEEDKSGSLLGWMFN